MPARLCPRTVFVELCAAPAAVVVYVECPETLLVVPLPLGVWPIDPESIVAVLAVN